MEKIFELKFVVPPIVFLVFSTLLYPAGVLEFANGLGGDAVTVITSGVAILGFGFLISSITYLLLEVSGLRQTSGKGPEGELEVWKLLEGHEVISNKIEKRWSLATTNAACAVALILAIIPPSIYLSISLAPPPLMRLAVWVLFLDIFFYHFFRARNDVIAIELHMKK